MVYGANAGFEFRFHSSLFGGSIVWCQAIVIGTIQTGAACVGSTDCGSGVAGTSRVCAAHPSSAESPEHDAAEEMRNVLIIVAGTFVAVRLGRTRAKGFFMDFIKDFKSTLAESA